MQYFPPNTDLEWAKETKKGGRSSITPEVGSKDFVLVNMLCRGKTVCLKPNIVKVILVDWLFFLRKT